MDALQPDGGHYISLEEWIIGELNSAHTRLEVGRGEILQMTYGMLMAIHQCITLVKITQMHDEIAEAYKNAVVSLANALGEEEGRAVKFMALFGLKKLESEKLGRLDTSAEYLGRLKRNDRKLVLELKRVFG